MSKSTTPRHSEYAWAYTVLLPVLTEVAREKGYALALHGSMIRDLDLIAVPWIEEAAEPAELIDALCESVSAWFDKKQNPGRKPHGRLAWSILPNDTAGAVYLDISVMPKKRKRKSV